MSKIQLEGFWVYFLELEKQKKEKKESFKKSIVILSLLKPTVSTLIASVTTRSSSRVAVRRSRIGSRQDKK
jgi:hypothetical protein